MAGIIRRGHSPCSYKLRDWLFSRQRYWGEPFPIVYDETGLPIALPDSMLPVELPPKTDFRPQATDSDDPRPPLSRAPGFELAELDLGDGLRSYRWETNTMPQWAGSCWYQGYILADAFTNAAGRYVPADGVVEAEDGLFYERERVRRQHGKMGKSLKNSISPDEIYESYGADRLRMYEMAMGPLDVDRPWQPDDIVGVHATDRSQ
jgi:leucyl-tRNA synthetase